MPETSMPRLAEELGVLLRPVAADDAHQLDGREEAGGVGEVGGGAARAGRRGGPQGVSMLSMAIEPTTSRDMA